jgi:hypothetical protein
MRDLQPADPRQIDDYQVLSRLGSGSQGVVFLALTSSGTRVAIKQLRAGAEDEQAHEQFAKEVAAARRVAPFCTAQLLEARLEGPVPYVVSEYIEGPSLHQKISQDGPMTGATLQRLAIGTVTALAAIHQAGVVHRDFKPANVMLSGDGPRVIDFGIARDLAAEATLTSTVFGTPAFMSPEQLRNEPVGPPADMFAWASVVAFAATGRAPFQADHMMAVAYRITHGEATLDGVPAGLMTVLEYCLAADPAQRPSAEQALALLLGRPEARFEPPEQAQLLARGSRIAQAAEEPPPRALKALTRSRRRLTRGRVALAVVLACILAGGGWEVAHGPWFDPPAGPAPGALAAPTPAATGGPTGRPSLTASGPARPAVTRSNPARPRPAKKGTAAPAPSRATVAPKPAITSATGTGPIVGLAGKCLDIVNARSDDGTEVQLVACNDSKAQIWTATEDGTIEALGKCLNVAAGTVEISACDGSGDQSWRIASGTIVNTGSRDCLAPLGGDRADRTPVVVTSCTGGQSQRWSLTT